MPEDVRLREVEDGDITVFLKQQLDNEATQIFERKGQQTS